MTKKKNNNIGRLFILFPLLLPVWKETYFSEENIGIKETPTFISDNALQEQKAFFIKVKDPGIRSKMVFDLLNTGNPKASEILKDMIKIEKDEEVVTDILAVITESGFKYDNISKLKTYMKSENPRLRGLAAILYLDNANSANSADSAFDLLEKENIEYVLNTVWAKLINKNMLYTEQKLLDLAAKFPKNQSVFFTRAIVFKSHDPDDNSYLQKILTDGSPLEKAVLAESLAERASGGNKLIFKLSEEEDPRIRVFLAKSFPDPKRCDMLIKLSEDKDYEIRRNACISLGKYGNMNDLAVMTIIKKLSDEERQVRDAAEQTLIEISIGEKYLNELKDNYLEDEIGVGPAIIVLGRLKFAAAAPAIHEVLKKTTDDEIRERAVYTLGNLKYSPAAADIASLASSSKHLVRKAVAFALGQINESSTYEILAKLSADPEISVSTEAFDGIAATRNQYFCPAVLSGLKNVNAYSQLRSSAARAAGYIEGVSEDIIKRLRKNALEQIIIVEGERMYDADCPRASVAWALAEIAKRNIKVKSVFDEVAEMLMIPPEQQMRFPVSTEYLVEYTKQADKYFKNENCKPGQVKPATPVLTVNPMK